MASVIRLWSSRPIQCWAVQKLLMRHMRQNHIHGQGSRKGNCTQLKGAARHIVHGLSGAEPGSCPCHAAAMERLEEAVTWQHSQARGTRAGLLGQPRWRAREQLGHGPWQQSCSCKQGRGQSPAVPGRGAHHGKARGCSPLLQPSQGLPLSHPATCPEWSMYPAACMEGSSLGQLGAAGCSIPYPSATQSQEGHWVLSS